MPYMPFGLVEIVLNVVQIAISPRTLHGLGEDGIVADQVTIG